MAEAKTDDDILKDLRKYLKECVDEEDSERANMADDLRFASLDQWPQSIRNERQDEAQEGGPRPCLTIDKYSQFHMQVLNDISQGKPGINVRPQDDAADIQTAKILKGLVRNIEDQSKADIAYKTAADSQIKIGLGFFRITTEYVSENSFDQDIFIKPIPNTFSAYLGKHVMPDGSDADRGYIVEQVPLDRFKAEYPNAKAKPDEFDELQDQITYWHTGEMVTVVEEYCIYQYREELFYLSDGTTISEEDYKKWPAEAGERPRVMDKRSTMKRQLKWRKVTGVEILDKRDLPGKYIPIVEVVGRESWVDGRRVLWGMVRPAKDSLRMYNYWASFLTEKFGLAGKTPYIGAKGQFEGLESRWRDANKKNFPYLEYNPIDVNGTALPVPQRQGPTPMEAAYFHQMQVIEHDVQTSLGMFKAATGESESQQSGRAILALQKESDTGTYHFGANLGISIRHAGRIIVDMIPHYYDTKRVVRIIGEDGEIQTATLDPEQDVSHREVQGPDGIESIYNPSVGQYDVSVTVGPSYNTKRMEDQAMFVEMAKGASDPASAAAMRYLVVRNSDNPGAQEAAKIFKALLPPQALQAMATKEPIPPQAQAIIQQMHAQMAQMQEQGQELQQENQQLKAGAQVKQMEISANAQADQQKLAAENQQNGQELALKKAIAVEEANLARQKAEAEAQLKREIAAAEHGVAMKKIQFEREQMKTKDPAFKLVADAVDMNSEVSDSVENLSLGISEALQAQAQVLSLLNDKASGWKTINIGNIQRGSDGSITGAKIDVKDEGGAKIAIPTATVTKPQEAEPIGGNAPAEVDLSFGSDEVRQSLSNLTDTIRQAMQMQVQALSTVAQELSRPTHMNVGTISRRRDGNIDGASITVN